jgi:hypothetical protein
MAPYQTQAEEMAIPAAIIDALPQQKYGKRQLLKLLKSYRVDLSPVKDTKVPLEEVISTLRKAKIHVPEPVFKALAVKLD